MTLGAGFGGHAARDRTVIAANCVCAQSAHTVVDLTTLHAGWRFHCNEIDLCVPFLVNVSEEFARAKVSL